MTKRINQFGIRISDEHAAALDRYCQTTSATPSAVITALVESYCAAMIETGTLISPNLKNFDVLELMAADPNGPPYKTKRDK